MTFVWRTVYNCLCKPCRHNIVQAAFVGNRLSTEAANNRMQNAIDKLCVVCKSKVKEIMDKEKVEQDG